MIVIYVSHGRNVPSNALCDIHYARQLYETCLCRSTVVYAMVQGLRSFFDMRSYIISVKLSCAVRDLSHVSNIGVIPVYTL